MYVISYQICKTILYEFILFCLPAQMYTISYVWGCTIAYIKIYFSRLTSGILTVTHLVNLLRISITHTNTYYGNKKGINLLNGQPNNKFIPKNMFIFTVQVLFS